MAAQTLVSARALAGFARCAGQVAQLLARDDRENAMLVFGEAISKRGEPLSKDDFEALAPYFGKLSTDAWESVVDAARKQLALTNDLRQPKLTEGARAGWSWSKLLSWDSHAPVGAQIGENRIPCFLDEFAVRAADVLEKDLKAGVLLDEETIKETIKERFERVDRALAPEIEAFLEATQQYAPPPTMSAGGSFEQQGIALIAELLHRGHAEASLVPLLAFYAKDTGLAPEQILAMAKLATRFRKRGDGATWEVAIARSWSQHLPAKKALLGAADGDGVVSLAREETIRHNFISVPARHVRVYEDSNQITMLIGDDRVPIPVQGNWRDFEKLSDALRSA